MFRRALTFVLILTMFWQSAAIAGICASAGVEDAAHVVMHWQDSNHHHHDDGALHADDTGGNFQHMHTDSATNFPGLLTAGWNTLPSIRSGGSAILAELRFPSAVTQGLLRPPRTHA